MPRKSKPDAMQVFENFTGNLYDLLDQSTDALGMWPCVACGRKHRKEEPRTKRGDRCKASEAARVKAARLKAKKQEEDKQC